jgi:HD superfamily phosphodiesterase
MIVDEHNIYIMNSQTRFSNTHHIHDESIASHTFYVCYFVLQACREYEIPDRIKYIALEAAILHDIPEVITNDITHDVKEMVKGLPELLQPFEERIIKEHSVISQLILFDEDKPISYQLAKALITYGDIKSVALYLDTELKLGNSTVLDMIPATNRRLTVIKDEMEELVGIISKLKGEN